MSQQPYYLYDVPDEYVLFYFQPEDSILSALEIERKVGLNPLTVGDVALNVAGVFKITQTANPFDLRLFSVTKSFTVANGYAAEVWNPTPVTLSDAKVIAKRIAKEKSASDAGTGDEFQELMLIAAASKLAADRSTVAQDALDNLTTILDALVVDLTAIDAAADVNAVDAVINPVAATYTVTVAGGVFYIDGVQQDSLTLSKDSVYRFDQSDASNSGHPLEIYDDANKTTQITEGVTYSGTPGSAGSFTQFTPVDTGTYSYQCSVHAAMGGSITVS